jgi:uncharacterized alkaline shock family protein YloU
VTEGHSSISRDVLERYAADAAMEVPGVLGLVGRRSVRFEDERVELHLAVDWAASIPAVAQDVQARVREYLASMTDLRPTSIDVVVDEVGPVG